jgi:hypothetical protein
MKGNDKGAMHAAILAIMPKKGKMAESGAADAGDEYEGSEDDSGMEEQDSMKEKLAERIIAAVQGGDPSKLAKMLSEFVDCC